ncbi:MAG: KTSC domain-containing protein [Burkholderiales bacterium]
MTKKTKFKTELQFTGTMRVRSSAVAEVGYDPIEKTLEVAFRSGKVYRYLDVPETKYYEMLLSDSIGRFVNTQIKTSFDFREVERPRLSRTRGRTLH